MHKGMIKNNLNRLVYVLKSRLARLTANYKATALLASFHQERLKNLQPLVCSILKCQFISKVILSNHNPDFDVNNWINIEDKRLLVLNQPVRRGPGYCWELAHAENSDYYLLIDDDFLITAEQIKLLIQHLTNEPGITHGITGHYNSKYYQSVEMEVNRLNQIYAITRAHLDEYFQYVEKIKVIDPDAYKAIEPFAHEIILSKTGNGKPKIHNVGPVLRCPTARKPSVAIHQEKDFRSAQEKVVMALEKVMQNQ